MKSRNPSLLSNSGLPRRADALPNRPNCIVSSSCVECQGFGTADEGLYGVSHGAPSAPRCGRREGSPLNCAPSADAVAGNGRPLSYSLRSPSAHAMAGGTATFIPRTLPLGEGV